MEYFDAHFEDGPPKMAPPAPLGLEAYQPPAATSGTGTGDAAVGGWLGAIASRVQQSPLDPKTATLEDLAKAREKWLLREAYQYLEMPKFSREDFRNAALNPPGNWNSFLESTQPDKSFFQSVGEKAGDGVLKDQARTILDDFGSKDGNVRAAAARRAIELPIQATKYLEEGLKSKDAGVRSQTETVLATMRGCHVLKCLDRVEALQDGLSGLYFARALTPELRKIYDSKLIMSDNLGLTPDELKMAAEIYKLSSKPGDPDYQRNLDKQYKLTSAATLSTYLRIKYADLLIAGEPGRSPEQRTKDHEQATKLLIEGCAKEGWQDSPGAVIDIVKGLGKPIETYPPHVRKAYSDSVIMMERARSLSSPLFGAGR